MTRGRTADEYKTLTKEARRLLPSLLVVVADYGFVPVAGARLKRKYVKEHRRGDRMSIGVFDGWQLACMYGEVPVLLKFCWSNPPDVFAAWCEDYQENYIMTWHKKRELGLPWELYRNYFSEWFDTIGR